MTLAELGAHLDAIGKIVGGSLAIAGAIFAFFKWIVPLFKNVSSSFKLIEQVAHEMRPNGGGSIKDSVNRIETGLTTMQLDMSSLRGEQSRTDARQWAIVAALPEPITEANERGEMVRANYAYLALMGRQLSDMRNFGWENNIHPDDRTRVKAEWMEAVAKQKVYEGHHRIVTAQGLVYEVWTVARPYFNPTDNTVLGWIGRYLNVKLLDNTPKKV